MKKPRYSLFAILLGSILVLTACSQSIDQSSGRDKLKVVATTSIVGDVVLHVGGDLIELSVLLPVGTNPHSFEPTPRDVAKVAEAGVVFANGAGLETFLDNLIESAGAEEKVVYVSEGIDFLIVEGEHDDGGEMHSHEGADPHTWTNPLNVITWVDNIEDKLSEMNSANTESFESNAEMFKFELNALNNWIREQVAMIPEGNRQIVTDHTFFGYFSFEYGFMQIGALISGSSTLAEPSAQELAFIEDIINELGVKAIFVGNTVNPSLAERVADDTGAQLVFIYTGSLGRPGSGVETYIDYMRYNTSAFVDALK